MKCYTILALAFAPISMAMAGTDPQHQTLTVVVGDYVGIEGSAVRKAALWAQRILREAGISTQWVLCRSKEVQVTSYGKCLSGVGWPPLFVRIVPKPAPEDRVLPVSMGRALPCEPKENGSHAYVYYKRILQAAEFANCPAFKILGHAMAHEIGHLLGNEHSTSGIMCPEWNRRALLEMSSGCLLFNPDEARRMRANVEARFLQLRGSR